MSTLQERVIAIPCTREMPTWVHLGDVFRAHLMPWSTQVGCLGARYEHAYPWPILNIQGDDETDEGRISVMARRKSK